MSEEETKTNILHLLPSKSTNKLKGVKPNNKIRKETKLNEDFKCSPTKIPNTGTNASSKSSIIEQNTKNFVKQEIIGSLKSPVKRKRGRPRKAPRKNPDEKRREKNIKKAMKDELKAAKRREAEAKRIERQMLKEEERKRKIMIEARQKAILADKLKQEVLKDKNTDSSSTQMGSFKIANSKSPVTQAIKPLPANPLPVSPSPVSSNPIQEVTAVPIDNLGSYKFIINKPKNTYMRRLEAYANRELDPSIIPMFKSLIARKRLANLISNPS